MSAPRIAILNGPNLDRLGEREPEIYGSATYADLERLCRETAASLGLQVEMHQVDGEGELVAVVHAAASACDGLILNAAGYTHTSVALRDALLCHELPVIEVHLSNPDAREPFRHRNLVAGAVTATVRGFGPGSYVLALHGICDLLDGT